MSRITQSILLAACVFLGGCASKDHIASDIPALANLGRLVLVDVPNAVLCSHEKGRWRKVQVGGGITGVRTTYKEVCMVIAP